MVHILEGNKYGGLSLCEIMAREKGPRVRQEHIQYNNTF